MNFDKLFNWVIAIVMAAAVSGRLELLQAWIWKSEAKIIYASRTSTWGSPRFFSPDSTGGKNRKPSRNKENFEDIFEHSTVDAIPRRHNLEVTHENKNQDRSHR